MTQRAIYLSPWRIDVTVRDGIVLPTRRSRIVRAMAATLDAAGAPSPGSIGLILTDDAEMTELNRVHMAVEGPTDVLSFPMLTGDSFPPHEGAGAARSLPSSAPPTFATPPGHRLHLGDVVISVERAVEQAAEGRGGQTGDVRWSAADELRLLVTHGTLHVCGWDHAEPAEEAAMRALEKQLLAR